MVCVCTMGKNENKYALEFVEYYKKIGVDKIIIYDNNDINGEKFESVLFKYIESKYVEIIDYRGKAKIQIKALNKVFTRKSLHIILFQDHRTKIKCHILTQEMMENIAYQFAIIFIIT